MRHPKSERFHAILAELGELHDKKQADYGQPGDPFANITASREWGIPPHVGSLLRLNDKVQRLKAWVVNGTLANEGAEDSIRDIAVYAIIALVQLEEAQRKQDTVKQHFLVPRLSDPTIGPGGGVSGLHP